MLNLFLLAPGHFSERFEARKERGEEGGGGSEGREEGDARLLFPFLAAGCKVRDP